MKEKTTGEKAVEVLRTMLRGGTWSDRESLARILQTRACACLGRFSYLHQGIGDFREDIPNDAVTPLLKIEESPECVRLPMLIREVARFLDLRPFPAVRLQGRLQAIPDCAIDDMVSLLLAQENERLLLALDDLLRHRVRQAQHHWWCMQNPRHGRWLRALKRALSAQTGLRRGKIGWHWALFVDAPELPAARVEIHEIRLALRDRSSRATPRKVLETVRAILEEGSGRYVFLGEAISVIVDMETADYSSEVTRGSTAGRPWPLRETDYIIQSIHGARVRETLFHRCSELAALDKARDVRLMRTPNSIEIELILVRAVVDDLAPDSPSAGGMASLRGRLTALLPADALDGRFQALYERARYMRRRLLTVVEEERLAER